MAINLPNPPPASSPSDFNSPGWQNWFARLAYKIRESAQLLWTQIDFTGSNITSIVSRLFTDLQFTGSNLTSLVTRNHNDLQNIQGGAAGDYQHLTTAQVGIVNGAAPLDSPAFTGTPTAPTATAGTNTTQLATTAFVLSNSLASKKTAAFFYGSSQAIAAKTWTTIVNPTIQQDPLSEYNVTTGAFTPTVTGVYLVSVAQQNNGPLAGASVSYFAISTTINSDGTRIGTIYIPSGEYDVDFCSQPLVLTAGTSYYTNKFSNLAETLAGGQAYTSSFVRIG